MRIGVLTGGGDCPGLNAAIRAIVRRGLANGCELLGFLHGWAGVLRNESIPLDLDSTKDTLGRGGTILGTSRTNPFAEGREREGLAAVRAAFSENALHTLIAIGGEDTLGVALQLHRNGLSVVGVPKTIDNDLALTDVTIGFDTAVQVV